MILNLESCPHDPIEAIMWLDGVQAQVRDELELAYAKAYYEARIQGRFPAALDTGRASRKRALALTRAENERRGRTVRWGDGLDRTD